MTPADIRRELVNVIAMIDGAEASTKPLQPYDMPALDVSAVKVDGVTWNADGSLWTPNTKADGSIVPVQVYYGYISPVKTPWVWEAARKIFTPKEFSDWEASWRAAPYSVYRSIITEAAVRTGQFNFMIFGYLMQPGPEIKPS